MSLAARLSTRQKITIARILNRCVRLGRAVTGRPMHGEFTRNGIRWALDLNEGIDFAIYLLGTFERDLAQSYRRLIPPGATVLDIGANIGAHTLPLAQHVGPKGRVIAIEATAYAYAKLQKNLELNPSLAAQTTLIQSLLTAKDDVVPAAAIHSSWPLDGKGVTNNILCGALQPTAGAKACTLDALLSVIPLKRIDWIKLDVDGHELNVLRGARESLARFTPSIFMELAPYCYADKPTEFPELVQLLSSSGYSFFRLPNLSPLPLDPVLLMQTEIPRHGSINICAKKSGPI